LFNGKRIRALTLIDTYTRECLATHVDSSIKGETVADILGKITQEKGIPKRINVDNGPEFISRSLDTWNT